MGFYECVSMVITIQGIYFVFWAGVCGILVEQCVKKCRNELS